jgi:hypothetical protein
MSCRAISGGVCDAVVEGAYNPFHKRVGERRALWRTYIGARETYIGAREVNVVMRVIHPHTTTQVVGTTIEVVGTLDDYDSIRHMHCFEQTAKSELRDLDAVNEFLETGTVRGPVLTTSLVVELFVK